MKSLYISDLDGTLLHSDQTFSEYETEKFKEFNKKGILFTVATARSMITGKMLLGGIPFSVACKFCHSFVLLWLYVHVEIEIISANFLPKIRQKFANFSPISIRNVA